MKKYNVKKKNPQSVWHEIFTLDRLADIRSATAANNALIFSATGLSTWTATAPQVRAELQCREVAMTADELKTAEYLLELLQTRAELSLNCDDIKSISAHIDFLVTS